MKIKRIMAPLIFCALVSVVCLSELAMAQSGPGSEEDPVVTKSYVDRKISEITGNFEGSGEISEYQMEFIIDEVTERLLNEGIDYSSDYSPEVSGSSSDAAVYEPVNILSGQIILGDEGTEMILRSGSAVCFSSGTDGLANTTTGGDVKNGEAVGLNNLLIVPRNDGRGLTAVTDAWLLVKGNYSLIN